MPLVAVLFPPRKKIVPFHAETRAAKISEQWLPAAAHLAPRARSVNDVGRRRMGLMVDSAFMEIPARTE